MEKSLDTDEVKQYRDDLKELVENRKPLITMLSQVFGCSGCHPFSTVAEEYVNNPGAAQIVDLILSRLNEVIGPQKLYLLYLVDSIVKNVGGNYIKLFQDKLVGTFEDAFKSANNTSIRAKLFKLRQSWSNPDKFQRATLIRLDRRVNMIDQNWPIDGKAVKPISSSSDSPKTTVLKSTVPSPPKEPTIHINPKFLEKNAENGHSEKDLEKARQLAQKKEQLVDLKFELDTLIDEISEDKDKKSELNQKLQQMKPAAKSTGERTAVRKKILEINKKLINSDVHKLDLETQIKVLETGKDPSKPLPAGPKRTEPSVLSGSSSGSSTPSDPRRKVPKPAPLPAAPVGKKKSKNTDKNNTAANVLKKELKKKLKSPNTNGAPPGKIARRSDSPTTEERTTPSEHIPKTQKVVPPKLPTSKIARKKPTPEKTPPKPTKMGDDAPDIIDPEAAPVDKPAKLRVQAKPKQGPQTGSRAGTQIRTGRAPQNKGINIEDYSREDIMRKADDQLKSGMLKQNDYDQLLQRLDVLDKLKLDKLESNVNPAGPPKNGAEKVAAVRRPRVNKDEDRRTRAPWYDAQHHANYIDLPHRRQDWRDHLWDQYHDRQGPPRPRPAGPPGHRGEPPPGHRGEPPPGHRGGPPPGPPGPHTDEWDPKHSRAQRAHPYPRPGDPRQQEEPPYYPPSTKYFEIPDPTHPPPHNEPLPHPNDRDRRRSVSPPQLQAPNYVCLPDVVGDQNVIPPATAGERVPSPSNPSSSAAKRPSTPPNPALIATIDFKAILNLVKNSKPAEPKPIAPPALDVVSKPNDQNYMIMQPDDWNTIRPATPSPPPPASDEPESVSNATLETDLDFDDELLPKIDFTESSCKNRIEVLVHRLYSGMPCTACGLRFLAKTQTSRYADHLDWHFRQNRKERKGNIQTHRKWYYTASQWLDYEEIEDAEQRELNNQKVNDDGEPEEEEIKPKLLVDPEKIRSLPVTAGDAQCAVCRERFQTFFDQEDEEWHYEDVIKDETSGKLVHFICKGDAENLLNETAEARLVRSESIASIESIEIDRPLDEVVHADGGEMCLMAEETEIEVKTEEEPCTDVVMAKVECEEEKMEVDIKEEPALPEEEEEPVPEEPVQEEVPVEDLAQEESNPLDDTTDLYGDLAELDHEEDQSMPVDNAAAT